MTTGLEVDDRGRLEESFPPTAGYAERPPAHEARWISHEEVGAEAGLFQPADGLEAQPAGILDGLRRSLSEGMWSAAIRAAVALGERDENKLTNIVFYARHPLLGGRPLRPDERDLASEWITIRDTLVRPALQPGAAPTPVGPGPKPTPTPTPTPGTLGAGQRLTTEKVRTAWSSFRCAANQMVAVPIFASRPKVNPLVVNAYKALEHALRSTGYKGRRAGSYACRSVRGSNPPRWSLHAYGLAIDIDWECHPRRAGRQGPARFSPQPTQTARCDDVRRGAADTSFTPQQVAAVEAITTVDGLRVFAWGGRWTRSPDAMHFQIDVTPAELARGIAPQFRPPAVQPEAAVQHLARPAPVGGRPRPVSVPRPSPGPLPAPFPVLPPTPRPGPTGQPLGTLLLDAPGRRPFRYQFTAQDALWTAKLILLEAGGRDDAANAAVLWAMFNRYAFFTHQNHPTFAAFLRRYSTPLQPVLRHPGAAARHMLKPEFVPAGGVYPGTNIPRGQLRRHLDYQAKPWEALEPTARAVCLRALRGGVPNPGIGNASDFANTATFLAKSLRRQPTYDEWRRYTETFGRRRRPPIQWIGEVAQLRQYRANAFFRQLRIAHLPANAVRILPP